MSTNQNAHAMLLCSRCKGTLPAAARFCPACGVAIGIIPVRGSLHSAITPKRVAFALATAGFIWAFGNYTTQEFAGVKPTKPYGDTAHGSGDAALAALRKQAEASPQDGAVLKNLAAAIVAKLQKSKTPAQSDIFDLIDILGKILKLDPKDREALLIMGDISFEQQVFDKSAEYYERYLKEVPGDITARSRRASALTFMARFDESIRELKEVLKVSPDNFAALAYLTVTYAQKGDKKLALDTGARALRAAPSGEAKEELSAFIEKVKTGQIPQKAPPAGGHDEQKVHTSDKASHAHEDGGASDDKLAQYFKGNPIAGPKFVTLSLSKGVAQATFKEFPMAAMPPFAKEKFFSGIKKFIADQGITEVQSIEFVDSASGAIMETISIPQ
jgi:tetratricopeptide (TPR) repeat protein